MFLGNSTALVSELAAFGPVEDSAGFAVSEGVVGAAVACFSNSSRLRRLTETAISAFIGSPSVTLTAPLPLSEPNFKAVSFSATASGETMRVPSIDTGCASTGGRLSWPAADASFAALAPVISSFPDSNPVGIGASILPLKRSSASASVKAAFNPIVSGC